MGRDLLCRVCCFCCCCCCCSCACCCFYVCCGFSPVAISSVVIDCSRGWCAVPAVDSKLLNNSRRQRSGWRHIEANNKKRTAKNHEENNHDEPDNKNNNSSIDDNIARVLKSGRKNEGVANSSSSSSRSENSARNDRHNNRKNTVKTHGDYKYGANS